MGNRNPVVDRINKPRRKWGRRRFEMIAGAASVSVFEGGYPHGRMVARFPYGCYSSPEAAEGVARDLMEKLEKTAAGKAAKKRRYR